MKLWAKILAAILFGAVLLGVTPTPSEEVTPVAIVRNITISTAGPMAEVTVGTKFVGYQNQKIQICVMVKADPEPSAASFATTCGTVTPNAPSALMSNVFTIPKNKLPVGSWYAYAEARLKSNGELLAHKMVGYTPKKKKPPKPGAGY